MRARTLLLVAPVLAFTGACGSGDEATAPADDATTTTAATSSMPPTSVAGAAVVGDRSTQLNLRTALSAAKTIYVDNEAYTDDVRALADVAPELRWTRGLVPTVAGTVYVTVGPDKQLVCLSAVSSTGAVFVLADLVPDGVFYGRTALSSCEAATVRVLPESWG